MVAKQAVKMAEKTVAGQVCRQVDEWVDKSVAEQGNLMVAEKDKQKDKLTVDWLVGQMVASMAGSQVDTKVVKLEM